MGLLFLSRATGVRHVQCRARSCEARHVGQQTAASRRLFGHDASIRPLWINRKDDEELRTWEEEPEEDKESSRSC
jgi:hypothetical protein